MDDGKKVVVQLVADFAEWTSNMQTAVDGMKTTAKSMADAVAPISTSINALYQSNSRLYTSLNLSMQQSREQAATSSSKIQQSLAQLVSSTNGMSASIRQMGAQSAAAFNQMSQNVQSSMSQIAASMAGIAQSNNALMTSLNLNIQRTREELVASIAALNSSSAANRGHGSAVGVNSMAIRELAVIMGELARGDMRRLGSSLFVLGRQFEMFREMLGGLLGPIGAVAVASAVLAATWIKGKNEAAEFTNALQITGNAAGLTASSYQTMAESISTSSHVTESAAKAAMMEIAKSGLTAKGSLHDLTEVAITFGRKTGEGTEEALKYLLKMKDGATKAAVEMVRDGYNLLSAAQIDQIRELDEAGEHAKAQELLVADLRKSLSGLADTTTDLARDWETLKTSIDGAYNSFKRWLSGTESDTDRIHQMQENIASEKWRLKLLPADSAAAKESLQHIIDYQQQIALMQQRQGNQQRQADAERAAAQKNRETVEDDEWAKQYRRSKDRLELELSHLHKYAAEKNLSDEQVAEYEAQIRRKYAPKEQKQKGAATQAQYDQNGLLVELNAKESAAIKEGRIYAEKEEDTANYWNRERTLHAAGSSDRLRAENAYQTALLAVKRKGQSANLAELREEMAQENASVEQKIALAEKVADMNYNPKKGENNQDKAYYDSLRAIDKLESEQSVKRLKEQQEISKGFATEELEKIDLVKSSLKIQLTEHQIGKTQYLELMRQQAAAELTIKKDLIDDEIALESKRGQGADSSKIIALNNQKLALDRSYSKSMQANAIEAAREVQKPWDDAFKHMANSFVSYGEKIIRHQMTISQGLRYSIGDLLVYEARVEGQKLAMKLASGAKELIFGKSLESAKTLTTAVGEQSRNTIQAASVATGIGIKVPEAAFHTGLEMEKTGATAVGEATRLGLTEAAAGEGLAIKAATAISQIAMDAYTAMAGAYAAIAAIPYVGPVLAPIAAGVAFAGVIAIAHNIASAEHGYDIPSGVNPIVQLHEEEKVLPKGPSRTLDRLEGMLGHGGGMGGGHTYNTTNNWNFPNATPDSFRASSLQIERKQMEMQKRRRS